jgi:hypothetical protein
MGLLIVPSIRLGTLRNAIEKQPGPIVKSTRALMDFLVIDRRG